MDEPFDLQLTDLPEPTAHDIIGGELIAYNASMLGSPGIRPLAVLIRDMHNRIIGGLWGRTSFGWFFVELLFIPEAHRSRGLGGQILDMAEAEARARGCVGVWLDTLSADARAFYERRGYGVFGCLDNYPAGNARFFLSKEL